MDPQIINKVLSKNASPEEARQVAVWFATDEGREYLSQRYDKELYILDEMDIAETVYGIPSKRMKIKFDSQRKKQTRTPYFKLVAITIPFIALVYVFVFVVNRTGFFASNHWSEVVVPHGEQLQLILQDGTSVQINSGSRLQYPKSFGLFSREIKFNGEGYFSVSQEQARPFVINLNDIEIKVTGTKFNAKAYPDDEMIFVSLEEGSVNITDKNNHSYPLKAGQNAVFDKNKGVCSINEIEDINEHIAWCNKSLYFYRAPLEEVLKTVERQYGVQFNINDSSLLKYKFSISNIKSDVSEILKDIEKISKIRFELKGNNNYEVLSAK